MQLHMLVAGVMEQAGVKQMVDLGCGEGKLLEHLIRSQDCPSLTHMVHRLFLPCRLPWRIAVEGNWACVSMHCTSCFQ